MNDKDEMKLKIAKGYVRVVSLIITPVFALANLFMIVLYFIGIFDSLWDALYPQSLGPVFMEAEDFFEVLGWVGFGISSFIYIIVIIILLALLVLKIIFFIKALSSKSPDNSRSFIALSVVNFLDSPIGFFIYLLSMMVTIGYSGILNDILSVLVVFMIIVYISVWPLTFAVIPVSGYCKKQEEETYML